MEQRPDSNGPERHVPSAAATDRLREELRREVGSYAEAVDRDLDVLALLDAEGNPDEAVEVLQAHIARLEALQARVQLAVSGAVAEREAEAVIDRALGVPPSPAPLPVPEPPPQEIAAAAGGRAVPLRRAVVALVAVAALGTVVLGRPAPVEEGLLTAVEVASEQASVAAVAAGAGDPAAAADLQDRSAALEAAIDDLPADALATDQVRDQVTSALAGHRDQLLSLVGIVASAPGLLAEVEELAASLGLPLPPVTPAAVPLDLPPTTLPRPDGAPQGPATIPVPQDGPGQDAPDTDAPDPDAPDPGATDAGGPGAPATQPTPTPAQPGPAEPTEQPEDLDLDLNGDGEQPLDLDADGLG